MPFLRRLMFYLIGIFLGIGLVYVLLLKNRDMRAWLPADVIHQRLDTLPLSIPDSIRCQLECDHLSVADLRREWSTAEIDFSNSETGRKPCPVYLVRAPEISGIWVSARIVLCRESAELVEWNRAGKAGDCHCR